MMNKEAVMEKKNFREILYHIFLILFALCMLYPLIWMFFSSFKPNAEILKGMSLLPEKWTFENYVSGWAGI